jgi:hypothetical protein
MIGIVTSFISPRKAKLSLVFSFGEDSLDASMPFSPKTMLCRARLVHRVGWREIYRKLSICRGKITVSHKENPIKICRLWVAESSFLSVWDWNAISVGQLSSRAYCIYRLWYMIYIYIYVYMPSLILDGCFLNLM